MSKKLIAFSQIAPMGLLVAGLILSGCGEGRFGGALTGGGANGTPRTPPSPTPTGGANPNDFLITWFSPCSSSQASAPEAGTNEKVISGKGPHSLSASYLDNPLNIRFIGEVCGVQSMPRDIIFVVDVSGSMASNDPVVGGTCGRRKAVEAVVASAGENGFAKFGVVTFSGEVTVSSKGMQGNLTSLTNDLLSASGQSDINAVLCGRNGSTNYDAGLTGAESLYSSGRASSLKEIYFVSDGQPDPSTAHGKEIAAKLKTTGVSVGGRSSLVTIVTTMLGLADDSIMRDHIASKDIEGEPLHSQVDSASRLADALKSMSQNSLEDGSIEFGATGETSRKTISLKTFLKSTNYQSDFIALDPNEIRGGVDMMIEFKDKAANSDKKTGSIVWQAED